MTTSTKNANVFAPTGKPDESHTCRACGRCLPVNKFPTITGPECRDTECRACRDERTNRKAKNADERIAAGLWASAAASQTWHLVGEHADGVAYARCRSALELYPPFSTDAPEHPCRRCAPPK
jgi:hypothetical protein